MEFSQIQDLIKLVSRSKIAEVEIKEGDFKIIIRSEGSNNSKNPVVIPAAPSVVSLPQMQAPMPVPPPAAPAPAAAAPSPATPAPADAPKEDDSKYVTVKSPMVGTFYRSASPDKPPFVKIGDSITNNSTVCIIEAMKLFNEIEAEVSGTIVKVLVEDAQSVEYDQPLFLVDPS